MRPSILGIVLGDIAAPLNPGGIPIRGPGIGAGDGTVTAEGGEFSGAEFDTLGGGDVDHDRFGV
jgi:hypothetical protein